MDNLDFLTKDKHQIYYNYIMLRYCFISFISLFLLSTASWAEKMPPSLHKAQELYERGVADYDPVALNRAAAMALRARDAKIPAINSLAAAAHHQLALIYFYNHEPDMSRTMAESATGYYNKAASRRHNASLDAQSARIIHNAFSEYVLKSADPTSLTVSTQDLALLKAQYADDAVTLRTIAYRNFYHGLGENNVDSYARSARYFRRLLGDNPDNIAYKTYYAFALGKANPDKRDEAMVFLSELIQREPHNRLALYLRGLL